MNVVKPSAQHLLAIGRHICGPADPPDAEFNLRQSLRAVQADLADLNLTQTDVKLISVVFHVNLEGDKVLSAPDLLTKVFSRPVDRLAHLDRLRRLVLLKVFEPCEKAYRRRNAEDKRLELALDRIHLLDMGIRLHTRFLARLLGEEIEADPESVDTPYADNREFLQDWFSYLDAFREYKGSKQWSDPEAMMRGQALVEQWERRREKRLARTEDRFPFQELVEEYGLDRNEQTILMYMLKEELNGQSCSREELLDFISEDKFDQYRNGRYLERDGLLIGNGLVEICENMFFINMGQELRLAADVASIIMRAIPKTDQERVIEIIRCSDILKLTKPHVALDQLILPQTLKNTLETAITQCRCDVGRTLHDWGLNQGIFMKGAQEEREYKPAMLLLFSGAPGTGKTFAAGAIARSLGKDLLVTDVSRLLSCWVGESEANVHRLFAQYDQIVRRTENPPVLLLNECDQFLTSRGQTERSTDRMYNQMENLFLEAFERFQGVLIATTNLRGNLDPAFSRRFHLKLDFPKPDAEARRQLWAIHLPESLPRSADVDIAELAANYALTGGQIAVVVKNAAVEAAQGEPAQRRLTRELLIKYARLELETAFGDRPMGRIGFEAA